MADQIMVNGNHTHSGPTFSSMKTSKNPAFKAYYAYAIQQIVDAALEAYTDRAEAVMTKGAIDAKESTAYLGYNNGKGYHMNAIRHYVVTSQNKTDASDRKQHVQGSNYGGMSTTMKNYKKVTKVHALESDNTMYILLFEFPNHSEKEPIIFVNWRAHSTTNSGGANKTFVSGDYANSIRANMKKAGYRAAFFQGASGNGVTSGTEDSQQDWKAECYKELGNYNTNTNVYGRILTRIALDCIARKGTRFVTNGYDNIVGSNVTFVAVLICYRDAILENFTQPGLQMYGNVVCLKEITEEAGVCQTYTLGCDQIVLHFHDRGLLALQIQLVCNFTAGETAADDNHVISNLPVAQQILYSLNTISKAGNRQTIGF